MRASCLIPRSGCDTSMVLCGNLLLLICVPKAFLCRKGRNDFVCCTVHLRSKSCMQAAPGAFVGFVAPGEFF